MKKVVILGAGESGVGAALLAQQLKYDVFVSDRGAIKDIFKNELIENNIPFEEKQHSEKKIFDASVIIKSPGIPDKVDMIQRLKEAKIPVISEIEFASKHTNATIVAITGSNGKTTTTKLTHHLLHTARLDAAVGGNIGYSFARLLTEKLQRIYVLELSSFQLDGILDFNPDIAVLLNITPDHLDRYDYEMSKYIASKFRITMNQQPSDYFIFNESDDNILAFLKNKNTLAQTIPMNTSQQKSGSVTIGKNKFQLDNIALKGKHNQFNASCAIQAALLLGVDPELIQKGLDTFINVPHRLELIATIDEVTFVNDSKATNVDATWYALDAMTQPIIWVVGGTDKGNDYEPLLDLVEQKVKAIVCLGLDNTKIFENFSPIVKIIEETQSANAAVELANLYAEAGDVVLLSPACASFDLFKNYEDRGNQFKNAILKNR